MISGVAVTSAGTYIVAAFLAGFSERYFLRFVERGMRATRTAATAKRRGTAAASRRPERRGRRRATRSTDA